MSKAIRDSEYRLFKEWTLDRWLAVFGLAIGALSLFGWLQDRQSSRIAFNTRTIRVIEAGRLNSAIQVRTKDGAPLSNDLYAVEIMIWNAGNTQLGRPSDLVREPLTLKLDCNALIVDTSLQRSNMPEGTFSFRQSPSNSIEFLWTTFDPNDAFKMLLLYQAESACPLQFKQRIVGASLEGVTISANKSQNVIPMPRYIATILMTCLLAPLLITLFVTRMIRITPDAIDILGRRTIFGFASLLIAASGLVSWWLAGIVLTPTLPF